MNAEIPTMGEDILVYADCENKACPSKSVFTMRLVTSEVPLPVLADTQWHCPFCGWTQRRRLFSVCELDGMYVEDGRYVDGGPVALGGKA